ncbi:hypothetical protein GF357_01285 [Candidatus Dojkabacteria bacterium]|nr:hypothetical protein [Candidatus Dojkabacteria bacterium]
MDELNVKQSDTKESGLLKKISKPKDNSSPSSKKKPPLELKPKKPGKSSSKTITKKVILLCLVSFLITAITVFSILYIRASKQLKEIGIDANPLEVVTFAVKGLREYTDNTSDDNNGDEDTGPVPQLKKDSSGRYTNILGVGIDSRPEGENPYNEDLKNTDTILVLSYDHQENRATIISIPRDVYVQVPNYSGYSKINGIYLVGENIEEGNGLPLLKETVEKTLGLEIQYYAMGNFVAVRELINIVDGIDICVENTFTDYMYPSLDTYKVYETVHFEAGCQKMDSDTALKFARSRRSPNILEGSDYARAKRQQKVVEALMNKMLSSETYTNPQKILDIIDVLGDNVKLSGWNITDLEAALALKDKMNEVKLFSSVTSPAIGNFQILYETSETGLFIVTPKLGQGNYSQLHTYIDLLLDKPELYGQDLSITVYDAGGDYAARQEIITGINSNFPYTNFFYSGTANYESDSSIIFSNSDLDTDKAIEYITAATGLEKTEKPANLPEGIEGDIVIFVGKPITQENPDQSAETFGEE